jgi:hypothetical protein
LAEDAENHINSAGGVRGWKGGGQETQSQPASLIASVRGGCGGEVRVNVLALNAT